MKFILTSFHSWNHEGSASSYSADHPFSLIFSIYNITHFYLSEYHDNLNSAYSYSKHKSLP